MQSHREVFTLDERHHEIDDPVALIDAVDRDDVRMAQLGSRFRFAQEPRPDFGTESQFRRQNLDGDQPLQPPIAGLVNGAHPAPPDLAVEFVSGREDALYVRSKIWVCRGSDWLGHAVGLAGYDDGAVE